MPAALVILASPPRQAVNQLNRRTIIGASLFAVLAVLASSGCGQKGPLFLPQDKIDEIERKRGDKAPKKTGMRPGADHTSRTA